MAHAVNLTLAGRDEDLVRRWWTVCDRAGIPSLASGDVPQRPHITLAVVDGADPGRFTEKLLSTLGNVSGPTIRLSHFGVFVETKTVLFLGVTPTDELRALQRQVVDAAAAAGLMVWDHYKPGAWVPHSSVAVGFELPALGPLLSLDRGRLPELPLTITTSGIDVDELPQGRTVASFPLS